MLVGPDDGIGILAGNRSRSGQAIARQDDRKPAIFAHGAHFFGDRVADREPGRDLTTRLIANLANVFHVDFVAGERQRFDQSAGNQSVGALAAAAMEMPTVVGSEDDRQLHQAASFVLPFRIASASAGSMRPS